jgi:hypothetical protein
MKNLVVGFDQFVNEQYEYEAPNEKTSSCCGAPIMEDGTCEGCGNFISEESPEFPEDNSGFPGEETNLPGSETELPNIDAEFAPTRDEFEEDDLDKDMGEIEEMDPENARNAMYEARKTIFLLTEKFPDLKLVKKAAKDNKAAIAAKKKGVNPFAKKGAAPAGKPGVKGVNPFAKKDMMTKDKKGAGDLDAKGKPNVAKEDPKKK